MILVWQTCDGDTVMMEAVLSMIDELADILSLPTNLAVKYWMKHSHGLATYQSLEQLLDRLQDGAVDD